MILAPAGLALTLASGAATPAPDGGGDYRLHRVAEDPLGGGDAALSPDGRRIVTSSKRSGNWDVWIRELESGAWTQVTADAGDDHEAQWSPDGQRLVFTSSRAGSKDIWTIHLATGALLRLTDDEGEEEYPNWSPDGGTIVYTGGPWKKRDIFVVPSAGGVPRKVTSHPSHLGACSFPWQGGSLICHGYDRGNGDVFLLPVAGGQRRLVTSGDAWDYKPTVMPRTEWFAYSRAKEGPSSIWLQSLAGGDPVALAASRYDDRWPTWSADGARLLFHRLVDRGTAVRLLEVGSGSIRTLTETGEEPGQAAIDAEGRRVVYAASDGGRRVIRVRDLATGQARSLDTGPGDAAFPRFSPDGKRIAFVRRAGERWEVCTADADGGRLRAWTEPFASLRGLNGPVDVSPDGRRLVFKAETGPFESDLFAIDTAEGTLQRLTHDEWFDEAPSWTPDGKGVVFMSTRGGGWTWGLFRLEPDGTTAVLGGPDYVEKNYPRVRPDGTMVWSTSDEKGVERVAERAADGDTYVLPTGEQSVRWPSYSADGRRLVFTAVERKVEYWLAENLAAPSSPLRGASRGPGPKRENPVTDAPLAAHPMEVEVRGAAELSPRHMHHR